MCSIIEIILHERDYRDILPWCIIWNCWCERHSRTERHSTVLARRPAGTSESAVRERGVEGGRGRGRGGGGGRKGGRLVGNAHCRREVRWPRTSAAVMRVRAVAVMRRRARVLGRWHRPDLHGLRRARAGGGALTGGAGGALAGRALPIPDPPRQRPGGRAGGISADQRVWHDALTSRFSTGVKTSRPDERIQILCIWENTQACHARMAHALAHADKQDPVGTIRNRRCFLPIYRQQDSNLLGANELKYQSQFVALTECTP